MSFLNLTGSNYSIITSWSNRNHSISWLAVQLWLEIYSVCTWTVQEVGVNQPLLKRGNPPISQLPLVNPPAWHCLSYTHTADTILPYDDVDVCKAHGDMQLVDTHAHWWTAMPVCRCHLPEDVIIIWHGGRLGDTVSRAEEQQDHTQATVITHIHVPQHIYIETHFKFIFLLSI